MAANHVGIIVKKQGKAELLTNPSSKVVGKGPHVLFEGKYYTLKKVRLGLKVGNGSVVKTGKGAKLKIVYKNGDQFNIGEGTAYRVAWTKKKVKGKKTMLDTSPRVILVQNVGLFSVGDSLGAAKIAGDLTETNARVISSVEETSKYKFIPEKDLFDVEYWSLEQAKIKKAKKELQGNVVVITGSFGAIGSATYKLFKSYGAEVVLLDYNLQKVNEMKSKVKDLCLHCDVTNKDSVKKAFKIISETYGGIDILISNAGTAIGGSIAEVDDKILRQSFEDNFFSHQNCASETIKIMKKALITGVTGQSG